MHIPPTLTLTLLTLLTTLPSAIPATPDTLTTRTGRTIPISALSPHLSHLPREQWHPHIFELDAVTHRVHTHSVSHDLSFAAPVRDAVRLHGTARVFVDGVRWKTADLPFVTRTAGEFRALYTLGGKPVGLSRNGASMAALSVGDHPGIFLDHVPPHKTYNYTSRTHRDTRRMSDDETTTATTNTETTTAAVSHASGRTCRLRTPARILEFATAFDTTFCTRYGGDDPAVALIVLADAVAQGEQPFLIKTCIRVRIVHMEGYCRRAGDPYRGIADERSTGRRISAFRRYWLRRRRDVHRDTAYLFTGTVPRDSVGVVFDFASCGDRAFGAVWSLLSLIVAHELGHSFSAFHLQRWGIMDTRHWSWDEQFFHPRSVVRMTRHVDGREGACLSEEMEDPIREPDMLNVFRTCQTGYEREKPDCTDEVNIGRMRFNIGGAVGTLRVSTQQVKSGDSYDIILRLGTTGAIRLKRYRRVVAMEEKDSGEELGIWVDGGELVKESTSTWYSSQIYRPVGMATCCDRIFYVNLEVEVCAFPAGAPCETRFEVIVDFLLCARLRDSSC